MTFERIQSKKIVLAQKLLDKLAGAGARLEAAGLNSQLAKDWLSAYAASLKELQSFVKQQRAVCHPESQCHSLLHEEHDELEKSLRNLSRVIKSSDVDELLLSKTLILIASRSSLSRLV
jgi:hypothetical protein